MKHLLRGAPYFFVPVLFATNMILSGCGTTVESAESSATSDSLVTSLQSDNQRLQDENAQLKKANAQLDQDKKALTAKVADLTSKLGQSSSQWQDLQDLQVRVNTLDSELTVEKQINRDLNARSAEVQKPATPAAQSSITSSAEFKKTYDQSLKLYNAKKYADATARLEDLTASSINDPLMSNAHFWLGECYYSTKAYDKAVKEFQAVLQYPKSNKEGDAYLALGMSYLRMGDKEDARSTWEALIKKYPKSDFDTRAKKYLNQL
jgi:tol-pal system protein YbgF